MVSCDLTAKTLAGILKPQKPQVEPLTSSIEHHIRAQPTGCVSIWRIGNGEINACTRTNIVQQEQFSLQLEQAIARYHNRSVDAIQVLQKLIRIAKDLQREPEGGLTLAERAFCDALAQNKSAVEIMSHDELRTVATELVATLRINGGTDWRKRDNVRAKMRVAVKRVLQRHGYPPDLASEAVKTVLKQAEALAREVG